MVEDGRKNINIIQGHLSQVIKDMYRNKHNY